MKEFLIKTGFDNIGEVAVESIVFEPSLVGMCEMNSCGNYGKCYTCPPLVGKTDELIKKAKSFDTALVLQKIYDIEDSFDIEGMTRANENFMKLIIDVNEYCMENLERFLLLGAGGCRICSPCGAVDGTPCRFPEKAVASLESYGIQVSHLASLGGMKYINGQNTVTYFGAIFI